MSRTLPDGPRQMRSAEVVARALEQRRINGSVGAPTAALVASGRGWRILDVVCTCDAHDAAGEERHSHYSFALVLAGAFRYRSDRGRAEMTPGSILLGTAGAPFRCWHDRGAGDRCLAFQFEPESFGELTATTGNAVRVFPCVALPVHRATTALFATAEAIARRGAIDEERGFDVAATIAGQIQRLAGDVPARAHAPDRGDARRIAEIARWIESDPAAGHSVDRLAARCGMSRFHFVRRFRDVTGLTPYAFVRRARLRDAGSLLLSTAWPVTRIALDVGFTDLSTFNAAFRQHFAASPSAFRRQNGLRVSGRSGDSAP